MLAVVGLILQVPLSFWHPHQADPNDSPAAFAEYAQSNDWVLVHIGQFAGALLITLGLVALARHLARQPGITGALATLGGAAAVLVAAVFAVQMAVDGVALKATIDAWTIADGSSDKAAAFLVADGIRSLEKALSAILPPHATASPCSRWAWPWSTGRRFPALAGLVGRRRRCRVPRRGCGRGADRFLPPGGDHRARPDRAVAGVPDRRRRGNVAHHADHPGKRTRARALTR